MAGPERALACAGEHVHDPGSLLGREWLVTNGLGGFAAGTLAGIPTRRYHALLVAALAAPLGRTVMLNHLSEFIDAWLKVHPDDRAGARHFLDGFLPHLDEACIGTISEIFDADAPYTPRGCVAQAWSVAEVLCGWVRTAPPPDAP